MSICLELQEIDLIMQHFTTPPKMGASKTFSKIQLLQWAEHAVTVTPTTYSKPLFYP